jgi:hypothetical protein
MSAETRHEPRRFAAPCPTARRLIATSAETPHEPRRGSLRLGNPPWRSLDCSSLWCQESAWNPVPVPGDEGPQAVQTAWWTEHRPQDDGRRGPDSEGRDQARSVFGRTCVGSSFRARWGPFTAKGPRCRRAITASNATAATRKPSSRSRIRFWRSRIS